MLQIKDTGDIFTSLLGTNAAQKLRRGLTVLKVWFPEMSNAKRLASEINLSLSLAVSVYSQ